MTLQTEFEFTLPRGYVDKEGNLHKQGVMRLATAADEIAPLRDPRVTANQAYLAIILLARVVAKLGSLPDVNTGVIISTGRSRTSWRWSTMTDASGRRRLPKSTAN